VTSKHKYTDVETLFRRAKASGVKPTLAALRRATGRAWELNSFSGVERGGVIGIVFSEKEDPATRGVGVSAHVTVARDQDENVHGEWRIQAWDVRAQDYRNIAHGRLLGLTEADFSNFSRVLLPMVDAVEKVVGKSRRGVGVTYALTALMPSVLKYQRFFETKTGVGWRHPVDGVYAPEEDMRTIHFFPRQKKPGWGPIVVSLTYEPRHGYSFSWIATRGSEVVTDMFRGIDPDDAGDPSRWFDKLTANRNRARSRRGR
jgi:hypothetical protein